MELVLTDCTTRDSLIANRRRKFAIADGLVNVAAKIECKRHKSRFRLVVGQQWLVSRVTKALYQPDLAPFF